MVDRDSGNLYPFQYIYITKIGVWVFLNLFAEDLGRPSCLVLYIFSGLVKDLIIDAIMLDMILSD